jgi:oligosaccharide repeat unit polymerase
LFTLANSDVARIVAWICIPFTSAYLLFNIFYKVSPKISSPRQPDIENQDYVYSIEKNLNRWFLYWLVLTAIEIAVSGGVPILWLITGGSKLYTEFGLPVIHVFVWTLLEVLAMGKLGLYLLYGKKRRLFIPLFQIFWGIVIVSRGMMLEAILQAIVLWILIRGLRIRSLIKITATLIMVVLAFGWFGDVRTGASAFRNLAQPTSNYPDWLPSGGLWAYIYATSPLANLTNTTLLTKPVNDALFSRTIVYMFPTPIRNAIYGEEIAAQLSGDMVGSNFNVSSAFIGPYLDYGFIGIGCYSALLGVIASYCWRKQSTFRDKVRYTIVAQCLLLTIFWNYLFYNPFLGQVFWIYFLFARRNFNLRKLSFVSAFPKTCEFHLAERR